MDHLHARVDARPKPIWERLHEVADAARGVSGGVWLLCPMEDPALLPKLDGAVVRVGDNKWIALPDAWVVNAHRSAITA
ncbi:hypothetical protein [Micromonospora zamorensis]|uniref:hypothetical protein n=1 Tax=Micromonospora zamorensis TaxID=709883 RepID=UPI0033ECBE99